MSVGQTSRQEDDDYADGYLQISRNGVNRLLGISGVCSTATSVIAVLFSLAPLTAGAQPAGRMPRVGVLYVGSPSVPNWYDEGFRQGLAELGYVEGKSAFLEVRWADGKVDRVRELAAELVHLKVDVIFAPGR